MTPLFAYTGYWIALLDPTDSLNSKAIALSRVHATRTVITSEMVAYDKHFEQAGYRPLLRL